MIISMNTSVTGIVLICTFYLLFIPYDNAMEYTIVVSMPKWGNWSSEKWNDMLKVTESMELRWRTEMKTWSVFLPSLGLWVVPRSTCEQIRNPRLQEVSSWGTRPKIHQTRKLSGLRYEGLDVATARRTWCWVTQCQMTWGKNCLRACRSHELLGE